MPSGSELRKCFVNHFALTIRANAVFQYSVSFLPELDSTRARRRMVEQHGDILGPGWLYDGAAIAFSPLQLGDGSDFSLESTYQNRTYEIHLHQTNQMAGQAVPLQVYGLLFREILRGLGLLAMGGKHYQPSKAITEGLKQHQMQLWPGFYTSVENTMAGSVLCVDVAHKVIRTGSILSMMDQSMERGGRKAVERDLIGQIVITRYDHRTYRIDGIEWDLTPLSTFDRSGTPCTFIQYYQEHHNTKINDRKQPLLLHTDRRSNRTVLLIPELCNMTGLTDEMRKDFKVMKDLARHTMVAPATRQQTVQQFAQTVNQSQAVQEKLIEWNVQVKTTPAMVAARLLPEVTIHMGSDVKKANRGEWQVKTLSEPVSIPSWLVIYPSRVSAEVAKFLRAVQDIARGLGISLAGMKEEKINEDSPDLYERAIKKHYENRELRVIVCVLMKNFSHSYARIKQVCSLPSDYAIPTQCVRSKTLRNDKSLQSICSKIVQQMNCKLGGDLWHVQIPLSGTMIVGIDVCHDTQSNRGVGKRSVVGFCASTNDKYTKYFSTVKFQGVGQEIVEQLAECFEEALENYRQLNGGYPEQVIVYRDGVGDGQFKWVLDSEMPQIKRVMNQKQPSMKLTVIIVQKRIHLRMFDYTPDHKKGQPTPDRHPHARNVPSGTVMDRGCVSASSYDFYLVNQNVRENCGTVTPTHYHVLVDEINLPPLHLQRLTFCLGHLYYNWSGAIRVPAPCQYAHKIAFLVGQAIHGVPDEKLRNLLYFL